MDSPLPMDGQLPLRLLLTFAALGAVWCLRQFFSLLWAMFTMFLRPGKDLRKYGGWALVTGCTDGIGRALAEELARKKINVVLVSRTPSKLEEVATSLSSKYGVLTKSVAVDLSASTSDPDLEAGFAQIESIVNEVDVGILINNAGVSYPYAKYLHELDMDFITKMINLNVLSLTRLTKIVVAKMVERKSGAVVNIGSGAASVVPCDPLYAVYAASKAYVDQFSKTLSVEYSRMGIDVQCQAPLLVTTKMSKVRRSSLMIPTPSVYAKCALKWVGYEARSTPYWFHGVLWAIFYRMPEVLTDSFLLSRNVDIRKRGMAKEAKAKKGE